MTYFTYINARKEVNVCVNRNYTRKDGFFSINRDVIRFLIFSQDCTSLNLCKGGHRSVVRQLLYLCEFPCLTYVGTASIIRKWVSQTGKIGFPNLTGGADKILAYTGFKYMLVNHLVRLHYVIITPVINRVTSNIRVRFFIF